MCEGVKIREKYMNSLITTLIHTVLHPGTGNFTFYTPGKHLLTFNIIRQTVHAFLPLHTTRTYHVFTAVNSREHPRNKVDNIFFTYGIGREMTQSGSAVCFSYP